MKLQILVSAVKEDAKKLAEKMNLQAESIIINQCGENNYEEFEFQGNKIRCYHFAEKGVGLSRNNALLRAKGDLCLFSDEDIVYDNGAAEKIVEAFRRHPEADMLLFNVRVCDDRRTYWTEKYHPVKWYNCGRYPAYSFALRTRKMQEKNLTYSLYFGGGAKYANGEDSLFISDCLKAGLKVYAIPVEIGEEVPRPSTWFQGYDEKFFHDRGVLYHVLYQWLAMPMGLRFLLKNKSEMCSGSIGYKQARTLLFSGIRDAKKGL
ncbi:MAG: glycosyltransferase [Lachnospiraceae bacterium]|nr:glycosyltransferase [Lachnospiraceae bacterium]